jgi:hypothetical protein
MTMTQRLRISAGGQVSVPAIVRKRWHTSTVVVEDRGDHLVVRPAPDNPVDAAYGSLAGKGKRGVTLASAMREHKREDEEIEDRKYGKRRP